VLKDAFHAMYMLSRMISVKHGLGPSFMWLLRDVMFLPDEHDRANLERYAAKEG
jgi:hypothetical protein